MAVTIDKRNGGCGVIFENKLYVWGGNTTDRHCPYKDLVLSSDSEEENGAPAFDPNLVVERAVILPRPSLTFSI